MGASATSSEPASAVLSGLISGRPGTVRKALRQALAEARRAKRMTLEHEVRAVLAERYAALVDRATKDADGRGLLSAGDKLMELLDTLPVRGDAGPEPAGGGGGGDSSGDERGRVLGIIHGPPTMGDEAHS